MMSSKTLAAMGLTLAGALALAGEASAIEQEGRQAKKGKPAFVLITNAPGCPHFVGSLADTLKKDEESIDWEFRNFCRYDQKVLLCVYLDKKRKNPFAPCQPAPGVRDIEKIFNVAGKGGREQLSCLATGDTKKYVKVVFTGADVPPTGCPDDEPPRHQGREEIRTHRLDIEIIP